MPSKRSWNPMVLYFSKLNCHIRANREYGHGYGVVAATQGPGCRTTAYRLASGRYITVRTLCMSTGVKVA